MPLEIREIQPRDTLKLRRALLRPHQEEQECVFPGDDAATTRHLGAFLDGDMIGLVSVYRQGLTETDEDTGYRFRALAVEEDMRGRGYARELLKAAETFARDNGAAYIWANARIKVKDFYGKLDYEVDDEEFIVEGVGPHVIVSRLLG